MDKLSPIISASVCSYLFYIEVDRGGQYNRRKIILAFYAYLWRRVRYSCIRTRFRIAIIWFIGLFNNSGKDKTHRCNFHLCCIRHSMIRFYLTILFRCLFIVGNLDSFVFPLHRQRPNPIMHSFLAIPAVIDLSRVNAALLGKHPLSRGPLENLAMQYVNADLTWSRAEKSKAFFQCDMLLNKKPSDVFPRIGKAFANH